MKTTHLHEVLNQKLRVLEEKIVDCTIKAVKNIVKEGVPLKNIQLLTDRPEIRILGHLDTEEEGEEYSDAWYGYKLMTVVGDDGSLAVLAEPYDPNNPNE